MSAPEALGGSFVPAITRRRFLLGAAALSAASVLELTGCAGPVATPSPPRWVPVDIRGLGIGQPAWVDLPPPPDPTAAIRPVPSRTPPAGSAPPAGSGGAWLVLQADGSLVAFDPRCTHQGCLYGWDVANRRFVCRCHAGWFDITGKVISGPPPRALDRMQTRGAGAGTVELGWQEIAG